LGSILPDHESPSGWHPAARRAFAAARVCAGHDLQTQEGLTMRKMTMIALASATTSL
jgi:hypothetical protein